MKPSWHAVKKQSSRKINAVNRSCAIFLQTSGSSSGHSSNRGQTDVPIIAIGSYDGTMLFDENLEFFTDVVELSVFALLWLCMKPVWLPVDLENVNVFL